jgi:hypothetical protein
VVREAGHHVGGALGGWIEVMSTMALLDQTNVPKQSLWKKIE